MRFYPVRYLALTVGCALVAAAQDKPLAITGAQIIPIAGELIPRGVLVVQHGKIVSIGSTDAVKIPDGAEVVDAAGKILMPGIVDSHSHIGAGMGGDGSNPIQPDARVLDSLDARDASIQ